MIECDDCKEEFTTVTAYRNHRKLECKSSRSPGCYPETAWPMKFRLPDGRRATTFFETKADADTGKRVLAYFNIDAEIGDMISG